MALGSGRRQRSSGLDAWPGYVDALSTLLMVIIFVLLVFVLAQGFLSVALNSRDRALDQLHRQAAELADMLALERTQSAELRSNIARLADELRMTATVRDAITAQLRDAREDRDRLQASRDVAQAERDQATARLADLEGAARSHADRLRLLEGQLAEALTRAEASGGDAAQNVRRLAEANRQLATERSTRTELESRVAELERQTQADRATLEARAAEVARLMQDIRALTALRDQLERQARDASARAADEESRRRIAEAERGEVGRLSESARAQVALLTQQLEALRSQVARLAAALDASEAANKDKDAQIVNLGSRLNAALAAHLEELQRYRSDFFGRLREVLGDRPEVRIVGDRFVFQSEVLFPRASAELSERGDQQIRQLAGVLLELVRRIPPDLPWVLRVDGHADRNPIRSSRYASNWELSAARAIAVAQLLIQEGLPANRVAATAFGEHQPIDPGDTPEALARNRRIELRLTDR